MVWNKPDCSEIGRFYLFFYEWTEVFSNMSMKWITGALIILVVLGWGLSALLTLELIGLIISIFV